MLSPDRLIQKAKASRSGLWLFNRLMPFIIPFNLPHGLKVTHYGDEEVRCKLPLKFRNKNHLGGLHACALAVVSEYTSGLLLIGRFSPSRYRLIMRSLKVDYLRQGRSAGTAVFRLSEEEIQKKVLQPLASGKESVDLTCQVKVQDERGEEISLATMEWQVKDWKKVRSKS